MKKKLVSLPILFILLLLLYTACSEDDSSSSSDQSITAFSFAADDNNDLSSDVTGSINGSAITAIVPSGTIRNDLIASFTTTGDSVTVGSTPQISGDTSNDFTSTVTYTVTAEDDTTQNYAVTVREESSDKSITAFSFAADDNNDLSSDVTGSINGSAITAIVPNGTIRNDLIASFTTTGDSVTVGSTPQISGDTSNDFTSTVTYTVTAEDDTTQDYEVTVSWADDVEKIYLFRSTSASYDGNLGGRSGADTILSSDANIASGVSTVRAFLSVDSNDTIKNMPINFDFPDDVPIYVWDTSNDTETKVADNWADLTDGNIDVDLDTAGLVHGAKSTIWWSGSTSTGDSSSDNCLGWTSADENNSGQTGFYSVKDAGFLSNTSTDCSDTNPILGVAY